MYQATQRVTGRMLDEPLVGICTYCKKEVYSGTIYLYRPNEGLFHCPECMARYTKEKVEVKENG